MDLKNLLAIIFHVVFWIKVSTKEDTRTLSDYQWFQRFIGEPEEDVYNSNPWQVCVDFNGGDSTIKQRCHCGGVLISNKWVLSAAHCFRSPEPRRAWRKSQYQFVLGLSDKSRRKILKAKNIVLHEGYKPNGNRCVPNDNDIALVELEQTVVPDGENIKIIKLPNKDAHFDGMSCRISDWDGITVSTLMEERIAVAPTNQQCNCSTCSNTNLQGDSGGAVACGDSDKVLAGVVQFAQGCNEAKSYLPITSYSSWISSITGITVTASKKRKKRMMKTNEGCLKKDYKPMFDKMRASINTFMQQCFGSTPEPTEFEFLSLDENERNVIISHTNENGEGQYKVYKIRTLTDIFTLIYHLGRGGLQEMDNVLSKHIIIQQLNNNIFQNGFLVTKRDFYVFPFRVDTVIVQKSALSDGSYQAMYKTIKSTSQNGYSQLRQFAGNVQYITTIPTGKPEQHRQRQAATLAHFTFATLFAESTRNWNSLLTVTSALKVLGHSTLKMFDDDTLPMVGGSWKQNTWGPDTEQTPQGTADSFCKLCLSFSKALPNSKIKNIICEMLEEIDGAMPACCGSQIDNTTPRVK